MTTTAPIRVQARPVPQCVAPAPEACSWCHGTGFEPFEELADVQCLECDGVGVPWCEFLLSQTHAYRRRTCFFDPASKSMVLRFVARKGRQEVPKRYEVREFPTEWTGRAFVCVKPDGQCHEIFLGRDGMTCSCQGTSYLSTAKANQRAWEFGGLIYPSLGCGHLDAVHSLLLGGWLDIETVTGSRMSAATDPDPFTGEQS